MDCFLFVFIFLLDDLDGNVLSFLPVDFITEASLDFIVTEFEFLGEGGVGEPFVFGEGEDDLETAFAFSNDMDSDEVLEQRLINFSDFLADDIV